MPISDKVLQELKDVALCCDLGARTSHWSGTLGRTDVYVKEGGPSRVHFSITRRSYGNIPPEGKLLELLDPLTTVQLVDEVRGWRKAAESMSAHDASSLLLHVVGQEEIIASLRARVAALEESTHDLLHRLQRAYGG